MKRFFALILILFFAGIISAKAFDNQYAGARPLALAGAYVAFEDIWSSYYNQAGLADIQNISTAFFYESRFQLKELSLMAGAVVFPTKTGIFGINYSQFGTGTFKESKLGVAFSKKLSEKFSAGIQFDYCISLMPENQRSKGLVTFEGGVIYKVSKQLNLGFHVFNPIEQELETLNSKIKMPAIYRLGGNYRFSELVITCFEIGKASEEDIIFKAGTEFLPAKNLAIRFGVSGKPFAYSVGFGYSFGKIQTDIAFDYHGVLGVSPTVSIQYVF